MIAHGPLQFSGLPRATRKGFALGVARVAWLSS
jgi:hypothetical protein